MVLRKLNFHQQSKLIIGRCITKLWILWHRALKRVDQEDCKIHSACIESLLLKTVTDEDFTDELATVVQFYGSGFSRESLRIHLDILRTNYDGEG